VTERNVCRPAYFKIIEEVVSQIVLHKSGLDPDFKKNHVEIDLQSLLDELKGMTRDYKRDEFI